ncbi:MAG: M23 family metallopeptidase [Silvanigrellales bacterium]|nr:M23 family metallopeptidase [Silvanigrellales bacterium]
MFKIPMRPLRSRRCGVAFVTLALLPAGCVSRAFNAEGGAEAVVAPGASSATHYAVMADATVLIKSSPSIQAYLDPTKQFHCAMTGAVGQRIALTAPPVYSSATGHYELQLAGRPCPLAENKVYVFRDQLLVTSDIFRCSSPRPTKRASSPQELKQVCSRPCFPGAVVRGSIDSKFCSVSWGEAMAGGAAAPGTGRAFGDTSFPFDKLAGGHEGTDFGAGPGTELRSVGDGAIVFAETRCTEGDNMCGNGYGNVIVVHHGKGMYSRYAHLQAGAPQAAEGKFVRKGEVIGRVGSTGWSDGAHLHIEIGTIAAPMSACQGPYAFDKVYAYDYLFPKFRNASTCK